MTKTDLLNLAVRDDDYTKEELAEAIDTLLVQLEDRPDFDNFWKSGSDFTRQGVLGDVSVIEITSNGKYDFNGGTYNAFVHGDVQVVSLDEWVKAIREAFELEA